MSQPNLSTKSTAPVICRIKNCSSFEYTLLMDVICVPLVHLIYQNTLYLNTDIMRPCFDAMCLLGSENIQLTETRVGNFINRAAGSVYAV